jgi:predicted transcriptional regulator
MPESAESLNEWQIAEILKSLDEADRGDFATDEDVSKVTGKWTRLADQA